MKTKCPDCCYPEILDSDACGCCEGVESITPLPTANRPGLSKLVYRIGTHASFLETMMARLSSSDYPQLSGLTTRDAADPSIALLDAWATVADVLTFYQERIANEGYLRSATERRSILELAQLVGYKLRPGVSSSVFLAYTIDENTKGETTIPAGSRAQSIPGPDELPQSFETSEDLKARTIWNNLKPRMTQPQTSKSINNPQGARIYLKGINTNLKPNDPLLISFGTSTPEFNRVKDVTPDATADRTLVTLQMAISVAEGQPIGAAPDHFSMVDENPEVRLIKDLTRFPSLQPASSLRLKRKLGDQFKEKGEAGYRTLNTFAPVLRDTLATAAANAIPTSHSNIKVYAFKIKAGLFGRNIPRRTTVPVNGGVIGDGGDWPIIEKIVTGPAFVEIEERSMVSHEEETKVYLDAPYDNIQHSRWMVIETQQTGRLTDKKTFIVKVKNVDAIQNRSKYGASGPTTMIETDFLDGPDTRWIKITENLGIESDIMKGDDFHVLRSTTVYAQPEELELAEEPIEEIVCGGTDDPLELDGFYEGLESGRWVIVSGERDISGTSGVRFSELAMLASVTQDVYMDSTDEKLHTFIKLAEKLQYCFKRDTITIYGNVAKATHGETRQEVLGSGDGSKALQSFELKQFPLTYVSASNPTGVDSTLKLIVNDMEWHEADSLAGLQATDRNFITKTDDEDKTTVTFGNGREGARLPTGVENIKAEYRNGIGKPGNVKAEQISLLVTKPLGVKEVINPLRASGGADRENRDGARKTVPLAVKALDRLVSVSESLAR